MIDVNESSCGEWKKRKLGRAAVYVRRDPLYIVGLGKKETKKNRSR